MKLQLGFVVALANLKDVRNEWGPKMALEILAHHLNIENLLKTVPKQKEKMLKSDRPQINQQTSLYVA